MGKTVLYGINTICCIFAVIYNDHNISALLLTYVGGVNIGLNYECDEGSKIFATFFGVTLVIASVFKIMGVV